MKDEYAERIRKLKQLFNIKETHNVIQYLLKDAINDKLERCDKDNRISYITLIHNKIDDIYFIMKNEITRKTITPFQGYKIFKLLLNAEKELQFFNDTVGDVKDYSYQKMKTDIEKMKPFFKGTYEIRVPKNPNDVYNELYYEIINDFKIKKNDTLNLLSIIYNMRKKAKIPKRSREEVSNFIELMVRIASDNGLTHKEIIKELEIDKIPKEYFFKKLEKYIINSYYQKKGK